MRKSSIIITFFIILLLILIISCNSEPKYTSEEWEEKQKATKENMEIEPLEETETITEEEGLKAKQDLIDFIESQNFGVTVDKFNVEDDVFILEYTTLLMDKDSGLKEMFDNIKLMVKISGGDLGYDMKVRCINAGLLDIISYTTRDILKEIGKYNIGYGDWLNLAEITIVKDAIEEISS